MRIFVYAAVSLVLLLGIGSASAADWTGWSIGISGGGGTGTSSQSDGGIPCSFLGSTACGPVICVDCDGGDGTIHMSGGLFGGGATYNFWQPGPWVFGIAGDYSWADISGSAVCGPNGPVPHPCGTALQSLGTIRGNVGYSLAPNWLLYGTAGYAGGEVHGWDGLMGGAGTSFLSGWSAGAGIQTYITQSLTLKFEYLHVDLGHAGVFNIVPGVIETVSYSGDIFRVGLDLKFGSYGPPAYVKPIYTK